MKSQTFFTHFVLLCISLLTADTFHVGSAQQYKTPDDVASIVNDGDTVLIDAETYQDQATNWNASNLILRGASKYAHLVAPSVIPNQKAIWVIKGDNVTVENIEFTDASVPDKNGAGIRAEGSGLTIRHCYFHDNEEGILGGSGEILIEYTIFANNGYGDGYSHNLYISQNTTRLTFQYCYSHHAIIGHNLKSRAQENFILYNRIMDEEDGNSSFCIDLPNGGTSYIIGNLLQQSPSTDNSTIVTFGEEGLTNPGKDCYIVNNTIVNDRSTGIFVRIANGADSASLINNLFIGPGTILNGPGKEITNLIGDTSDLADKNNYDYHLRYGSSAIDAGTNPGSANGYDLTPAYQYVHPASFELRSQTDIIDIGAYEYTITGPIVKYPKTQFPNIHIKPALNYLSIIFNEASAEDICLQIFDLRGRIISTISMDLYRGGRYFVPYSTLDLSAGVYILRITANNTFEAAAPFRFCK